MTVSLRDSPDALAVAAHRVEEDTGIPMAHVEKDFWVTEVLRGVATCSERSDGSAVFKGGTSLSKAYGLIRRFSEDVDIIVIPAEPGRGPADRCLKSFVAGAEEATGLQGEVDPSTATKGVKRTVTFLYPAGVVDPAGLRPGVRLELGVRGGTMPAQRRDIVSLVAEHASAIGLDLDADETSEVTLHVLDPVRTLAEKLMLLHHAASAGDETEQVRLARHYYDVWCLLSDGATVGAFADAPADVLAREVKTFSDAAGLPASPRPGGGFATSAAFGSGVAASVRLAFTEAVIGQLVWPDAPRPTFEDCCEIVHQYADVL